MLLDWLSKATFQTTDISGGTNGGLLSPAQAQSFLKMAIDAAVLVGDADNFDSKSTKFEIPRLSFDNRILRNGVEATPVGTTVKPGTSLVTISTALFRGQVPVSDEVFEDQIEGAGLADSIMQGIAEAVGRDVEELVIKSHTASTDTTLAQLPNGGAIRQLVVKAAPSFNATTATTFKGFFGQMIRQLPSKYRRNYDRLKFYMPINVADNYHETIADRGTGLGDSGLVENMRPRLAYQGIGISQVPLLSGTDTITGPSTIDYSTYGILCDPKNLKIGWHRRIKVEKWRDPREGFMSFVISLRMDCAWAVPEGVVLGTNIPAALK